MLAAPHAHPVLFNSRGKKDVMLERDPSLCRSCGAVLRQGHTSSVCDPCALAALRSGAPLLKPEFFTAPGTRASVSRFDLESLFPAVRGEAQISQTKLGQLLGIPQGRISEIEAGKHRIRDVERVMDIYQALGVPAEAVGLSSCVPGSVVRGDDEEAIWMLLTRRGFMSTLAVIALGAGAVPPELERLEAILPNPQSPDLPSHLGEADIAAIEAMTEQFRTWDYERGAGLARAAAVAQLRSVLALKSVPCPEPLKLRLQMATADLASITAWICYDCEKHQAAQQWWVMALSAARAAADHPRSMDLRVGVLLDMAHQSLHLREYKNALDLVNLANAVAVTSRYPVCDTTRSYVATNLGWVRASRGEADLCRRAMDEALTTYEHADTTGAAPWAAHVTSAEIAAQVGHSSWLLSSYDPSFAPEAITQLQIAVDGYGAAYARSRAVNLTGLAGAKFIAGDIDSAVAVGRDAVTAITGMQSRRAYRRLAVLKDVAARVGHRSDVLDLQAEIDKALEAA
jgi:transcriptional regulator with XRE-family HTH domain